jgi:hypothetical protein
MWGGNLRDGSVQYTGTMPFYYPMDVNFPDEGAEGLQYYYIENWTNVNWYNNDESQDMYEHMYLEVNLVPVLGEGSGLYRVYYGQNSYDYVYDDCEECDGYYYSYDEGSYGQFVVGTPTTIGQIDERINAGNVMAHYSGTGIWYGSQDVEINVNFADGSWDGTWNDGADGNVYTNNYYGPLHVSGEVGFMAEGNIDGNTFVSNSVSASDGQVSGQVVGAFFNPSGNAVAGVVDIVKTVPGEYTDAQHVSTFAAIEIIDRPR